LRAKAKGQSVVGNSGALRGGGRRGRAFWAIGDVNIGTRVPSGVRSHPKQANFSRGGRAIDVGDREGLVVVPERGGGEAVEPSNKLCVRGSKNLSACRVKHSSDGCTSITSNQVPSSSDCLAKLRTGSGWWGWC
jgi:hypothetical protein